MRLFTAEFSFLNNKLHESLKKKKPGSLRESGDGAEVVVDVEHCRIQKSVDVLETLEPGLESPPSLRLHLPQFLLRQLIQRGRRGRHR